MGILFSGMWDKLFGKKDVRILILGLDNAGKTTILYRLQVNEVVTTVPSECSTSQTVRLLRMGRPAGCSAPFWVGLYLAALVLLNCCVSLLAASSGVHLDSGYLLLCRLRSLTGCRSNFRSLRVSAIGFNVETVTYKNIKFQVWDLGM